MKTKKENPLIARLQRQCGVLNDLIQAAQDAGLDVKVLSCRTGSGIPYVNVEVADG